MNNPSEAIQPNQPPEDKDAILFDKKTRRKTKLKRLEIAQNALKWTGSGLGIIIVLGFAYLFVYTCTECNDGNKESFYRFVELTFAALISITTLLIGFITGAQES